MTEHILITGSNRGVGLALAETYLTQDDVHVFATCRTPQSADDLQALKQQHPDTLTIVQLDVNDSASIQSALEHVSSATNRLDVLINNAGIFPKDPSNIQFGNLKADSIAHVLSVNSIAPVMVTQAFADLLQNADPAKIIMMSSGMGSISTASASGFSYRLSKATLNMATVILSQTLSNAIVIATNPGWVATDMGGADANLTPSQSAQGLVNVIDGLQASSNGKFLDYKGDENPW